ncbi:glycoside hydrolase family 28 protein [uncultured Mucilaginibacter sp.]|uniref:glycoside hydrolase family 28 protein n=1 Tax=uncultured Mucilaginibacter sp. TaxID=797541 RepID=UPI0025DA8D09|nr:glycoside hydrolase family 28 protein [uncultured Mucilaginibacter sp.]
MKLYLAFLIPALFCACKSADKHVESVNDVKSNILKSIPKVEISDNVVSITNFGAKGDSVTDNKPAFDKALKACKEKKGCKITVPTGTYLVNGPIHLSSNTSIDLSEGAKLVFGTNANDYLPAVATSWEGTFLYNYSPLIYAYKASNVAITGKGTIDGNGANGFSKWYDLQKADQQLSRQMNHDGTPVNKRMFGKGHFLRPQLIQFYECKNILVEGVTIINSPFWSVHFLKSENITARKVKFNAFNRNNDGFDPEYSRNVLIEDIDFDNSDDNVAIKAGRDHEGRKTATPSENIVIRNCRFEGLHGVVIGSEMSAGVQNIFVENCTYAGDCKRGIYLKSNADRGGFIRKIYVNNLRFGKVEDGIYITSNYHGEGKGHVTNISQVYFNNIKFSNAANFGLVIQGYPGKKVKNIHFSNISIDTCANAVSFTDAENIILGNIVIGKQATTPSAAK